MKKYFPQWANGLPSDVGSFRGGRYAIRASLGRVWREFAVPATTTLDQLCALVLDGFDFDDDHLYRFIYRDRRGRQCIIETEYDTDGAQRSTGEYRVGELPLELQSPFILHYDFGDDWRFDLTIQSVDPFIVEDFKPELLAGYGEAPQQYEAWSDDDYDDE